MACSLSKARLKRVIGRPVWDPVCSSGIEALCGIPGRASERVRMTLRSVKRDLLMSTESCEREREAESESEGEG